MYGTVPEVFRAHRVLAMSIIATTSGQHGAAPA